MWRKEALSFINKNFTTKNYVKNSVHSKAENRYKRILPHWLALVLVFEDLVPVDYLIPTTIFQNPDEYLFYHQNLSDRHYYFSNVEIKVFTNGAARLREYAFAYQVENLK